MRLFAGIPVSRAALSHISFLAESLVLFQSQPGGEASVYHQLHTLSLGPCAAA